MPFPPSFKNIAILGLLQVGVVVAGVLGTGILHKCSKEFGIQLTQPTKFAGGDYGVIVVIVPLIWITVAMAVQSRNDTEDYPEALTFASGVLVLFLLLFGAFVVAILPWVRMFSCGLSLSQ